VTPIVLAAAILALSVTFLAFRVVVHRGLAPARVSESQTPADLGLAFEEARIPTANRKVLFGWFVPAPVTSKRERRTAGVWLRLARATASVCARPSTPSSITCGNTPPAVLLMS
jgi:hypothetical protein